MSGPVITHGSDISWAWQVCRCFECGIEERCTPKFDFYTRDTIDGPNGPLYCYPCILKLAAQAKAKEMN